MIFFGLLLFVVLLLVVGRHLLVYLNGIVDNAYENTGLNTFPYKLFLLMPAFIAFFCSLRITILSPSSSTICTGALLLFLGILSSFGLIYMS